MPDSLRTQHARGVFLMLASAACFTGNVLLVRALGENHHADVWLITCARFVIGLVIILAVYRRDFRPTHLVTNRKLISRGLTGGVSVFLTYLSVVKIGAGRATFIGNTYVIWGTLLAVWMLHERLRLNTVLGGIAALGGLGLLTGVFGGPPPNIYDLAAVAVAFLSAYIIVTIRQLHATEHSSTIFAAQCVYGLLLCAVPAFLHAAPLDPTGWMLLLLAGTLAAGGQLTMTRAFRDLPVAEGALLQMLVPIGIAVGGVVFFAERFTAPEIIGATLIMTGTAFTSVRRPAPVDAIKPKGWQDSC